MIIMAVIHTGYVESRSLTSYILYKSFEVRPSDNELVLDIKNVLKSVIKSIVDYESLEDEKYNTNYAKDFDGIYSYFRLQSHSKYQEADHVLYENGWIDDNSEFSHLLGEAPFVNTKGQSIIDEIVYIDNIECLLESPSENFFAEDQPVPRWSHGTSFRRLFVAK